MKIAAIVPAAGKGKRLKADKPKPFVSILGKPLLAHTLLRLKSAFSFTEIILPVDVSQVQNVKNLLKRFGVSGARVVVGGRTRAESVKNALWNVSKDCSLVLVHDAARPLISAAIIKRLIKEAQKNSAAICALPVSSTVKKIDKQKGVILGTEDRSRLYLAQTPQVFRKDLLVERYKRLGEKAFEATDEAALFDGSGVSVRIVEGEAKNIKITTREDIELMKFYLRKKH